MFSQELYESSPNEPGHMTVLALKESEDRLKYHGNSKTTVQFWFFKMKGIFTDKKYLQLSYMTAFQIRLHDQPQRVYYTYIYIHTYIHNLFKLLNTSESTTIHIYCKYRLHSLNLTAVVHLTSREEGTYTLQFFLRLNNKINPELFGLALP